jgi:hypothetical protein
MKSLRITGAKPNPAGKDRSRHHTPPAQLAAEWVDFINDGDEAFALESVTLQHIAYEPACRDGKWRIVMTFKGTLQPEQIVRIHSGHQIPLTDMYPEDVAGAHFHLFTGQNYVWNNDCGDTAGLWNGKIWIDKASYDPYPPEGQILVRRGDKLVP